MGGIRASAQIPQRFEFWAAILFLDVSGFTKITEAASKRGRYGVELITNVLNRFFDQVHKLIHPLGGEIVKFGGDACLIVIPPKNGKMPDMPSLADAIMAATARLDKRFKREYGFPFQAHGAWNTGVVCVNVVGSFKRHLDYYVCSKAVEELYLLANQAIPGQIVAPQSHVSEVPADEEYYPPQSRNRSAHLFFPHDIIRKLAQDPHPAELRYAAVLFIRISGIQSDEISLGDFQAAYQSIQGVIHKNLGLINKIDFNEKGYLALITFGIPFVYGNDTQRAIQSAYRLARLPLKNVKLQIGITYSNLYFGIIGAPKRHEYGIIGNAVNIAARLMSYAQPGDICISGDMLPYLEGLFETEYVDTAHVKGIALPLDIHRITRIIPNRWGSREALFKADPIFLEPSTLQTLQQGLASEHEFLAIIKGTEGSGKSQLVFKLCEPYLQTTPSLQLVQAGPHFHSLRLEIFFYTLRQELGISHFANEWQQIGAWASEHKLSLDMAAIKDLIFAAPNTPQRIQLALDQILDMLILLYPKGRMLVLEDFHHFDPQSQNLILRLIRHKLYQKDKVIVSTQEALPNDYSLGFASAQANLENWDLSLSERYIRNRIPNITKPAIRLLYQISQGNPRFLRDLTLHLQKHWHSAKDLITDQIIEDMRARGLLPEDLENLLRADFETLDHDEQLFVRLAGIYGRPLRLSEIQTLFPQFKIEQINDSLQKLLIREILRYEPGSDAQVVEFVNPLFAETVYRSILMGEKKATHRSIATYYSGLQSEDEQVWELAAHHWVKVEDRTKIAWWCGKLAQHYKESGALELSLRMWQQIAALPVDAQALTNAELSSADLYISLADNDKAEDIINKYQELSSQSGILHDAWVHLKARLMVNRAQYTQLQEFLASPNAKVTDEDIREKTEVALSEAILQSMDAQAVTERVLPLWQKLKDKGSIASQNILAGIIGNYYISSGNYKTAAVYYRHKLKVASSLKDPVAQRIGTSGLGIAYSRMGQKEKALSQYQKALELSSQSGDRNGFSKALLDLGTWHRNEGNYETALDYYKQSLSLAEYIGNKLQISIVIYDIGELYFYQEMFDEAEDYISRSLQMAIEIGDEAGKSFCYDALGDLNFKRENYPKAYELYRSNLLIQHKLSDMEGKAHSLGNIGNLAKMEKRYDRAAKLYHSQIKILSEVGDIDGTGRAWFNLAMLDLEQENNAAALQKLETALQLFQSCDAQFYMDITKQMMQEAKK